MPKKAERLPRNAYAYIRSSGGSSRRVYQRGAEGVSAADVEHKEHEQRFHVEADVEPFVKLTNGLRNRRLRDDLEVTAGRKLPVWGAIANA